MNRYFLTVIIFVTLFYSTLSACTVIKVAKDGKVFVGNNEDFGNPRTKIWFIPSSDSEYGRVCFGFNNPYGFVQGGMNEKGLTLDAIATGPTGWKPNPVKQEFNGQINDYILANFATIEEVKIFFNTYNVFLGNGEFMVADASGSSMIIEYVDGDTRFVENKKYYQIATGVVQYGKNEEKFSDHRYNVARNILEHGNEASVNVVRKTLSAVHKEWFAPTIYSYICDLKSKTVYVYNFHNFEEIYEFNLNEELKKGKHYFNIPDLFVIKTEASVEHSNIAPKRGADELANIIKKDGIAKAKEWFYEVKDEIKSIPKYNFAESAMVNLGYEYLQIEDHNTAIDVFKLATEAHPMSYNTWDSLAEAFMSKGDNSMAIRYYEKSIELNPNNDWGKTQIQILKNLK